MVFNGDIIFHFAHATSQMLRSLLFHWYFYALVDTLPEVFGFHVMSLCSVCVFCAVLSPVSKFFGIMVYDAKA